MAIISYLKAILPFVSGKERSDIRLLKHYDVFMRNYYQQQVPLWQRCLWLKPELHFLRLGWRAGLSPSPSFDARWYRARYPDVVRAKVNPLLHFLRYGVHEGRLPSYAGHISDFLPLAGQPVWLHHQAWHGHASVAIPKLKQLAAQGELHALWYLAVWYYGQSRYEQALSYLNMLAESGDGVYAQKVTQALVKCHVRMGNHTALEVLHRQQLLPANDLNEVMLQLGRTSLPLEDRLATLNHWYGRRKFVPLLPVESRSGLGRVKTRRTRAKTRRKMPLVSVVVPAFNAESTINIALRSLLAQSWSNLEIIVVDDASTDGTAKRVEKKARLETRLTLIRHERNQGAYSARNTGVRAARGAFVTVHDSDDWSHPQKIERQVLALIQSASAMASQSFWVRVDEDLKPLGPWHLCVDWLEPNPSSVMVRREVLDVLGPWDEVAVAADNEFVERLQKYYGMEALLKVSADIPLAFSLVQAASLTQRKATHVRTIHCGVRHLYHQAASWWRERQVVPVMSNHSVRRLFPTPLGNHPQPCMQYDIAIVADVSVRNPRLLELLNTLLRLRHEGYRVVVCPWSRPDDFNTRWLADDMWELCHEEDIAIAHGGFRLRCREVRVQALAGSIDWPDSVPQLTIQEGVRDLTGRPLPAAKAESLTVYLAGGGRNVL
ncbi:glycosyltransferase family 2 protein [Halomonas casei]|uniref:glycosyltransferase family 2 protein n=2 Tax=Halomonadaceae TaxID=28256 RepID=UPI001866D75E|nr:glycosyltransferase family A protein [Halomonas casei]